MAATIGNCRELQMQIFPITRRKTVGVKVGHIQVGGGAPVVVQSMTNTDTADIAGTVSQCKELADAGSELVRITVNMRSRRRRSRKSWRGCAIWDARRRS